MIFTPDPDQVAVLRWLDSPRKLHYITVGCGVGKTASVLHDLVRRLRDGENYGALVVAPMRVANIQWPLEISTWDETAWLKVANLRTKEGQRAFIDGTAHIYTINYESLHKVVGLIQQRSTVTDTLPYDVEVWDEVTKAKNARGKRVRDFRNFNRRAPVRFGMTGTPMPESELDLFGQVLMLDDGQRLGRFITHFKKRYFIADYMGYNWELREGAAQSIQDSIADITLSIPGKGWPMHVEDVEIAMPDVLMKLYKKFEKDLILQLLTGEITAKSAAALNTKLLQFTSGCVYRSYIEDEQELRDEHVVHTMKLEALERIAKKHKTVLVACMFKHELARIKKHFPKAVVFNEQDDQGKTMELWNKGKIEMLLSHPKSISHGLNLQHGGNCIVWFTPTYSGEDYDQFNARLARRGQPHVVEVYRLLCSATVDDEVVTALEFKDTNQKLFFTTMQRIRAIAAEAKAAPAMADAF